jgi:crossover junction endodeoxyribonuclease RuvC
MRVLGIDPGSRITGIGIVDGSALSLRCIDYICVKPKSTELPDRLAAIYNGVAEAVAKYQPDVVAVEQVFFAKNAKSALVLGQARGGAICAAVNGGSPVAEYSAQQIKRAVVGNGRAEKGQVQHMVRVLLGLSETPSTDAADALACAICHINTSAVTQRIERAIRSS